VRSEPYTPPAVVDKYKVAAEVANSASLAPLLPSL